MKQNNRTRRRTLSGSGGVALKLDQMPEWDVVVPIPYIERIGAGCRGEEGGSIRLGKGAGGRSFSIMDGFFGFKTEKSKNK